MLTGPREVPATPVEANGVDPSARIQSPGVTNTNASVLRFTNPPIAEVAWACTRGALINGKKHPNGGRAEVCPILLLCRPCSAMPAGIKSCLSPESNPELDPVADMARCVRFAVHRQPQTDGPPPPFVTRNQSTAPLGGRYSAAGLSLILLQYPLQPEV